MDLLGLYSLRIAVALVAWELSRMPRWTMSDANVGAPPTRVCNRCRVELPTDTRAYPFTVCDDCWPLTTPNAPKPTLERVNHPPHYTLGGIEVIDAIEAWQLGFHLGNAVKYIARADHKGNRLEDLEKARWYLDREIARMKGQP